MGIHAGPSDDFEPSADPFSGPKITIILIRVQYILEYFKIPRPVLVCAFPASVQTVDGLFSPFRTSSSHLKGHVKL